MAPLFAARRPADWRVCGVAVAGATREAACEPTRGASAPSAPGGDPTVTPRKCALWSGLALAAIAALIAAAVAVAGSLPGQGPWYYNHDIGASKRGRAQMQLSLSVQSDGAFVGQIQVVFIGGKCTKHGRTRRAGLVSFSEGAGTPPIRVNADASFSARFRVDNLNDETGHGTASIRGVFNGTRVSGTVKVSHLRDRIFGTCRATGKFNTRGQAGGPQP